MKLHDFNNFMFGTLRGRLILSVAAVHAVLMTLFIIDLTARQRAISLDRQIEETLALSQTLSTSSAVWIASKDIAGLQELVEVQLRYPELLFAILTDEHGQVLAHTDKNKRGLFLLDLPQKFEQTVMGKTPLLVDIATPAILGDRHVGWARVGIGQNTRIENCIIDKNARIGDNVVISPAGKPENVDHPLYYIRDGIVIIPKGGVIPGGTII